MAARRATARWEGSIREGGGTVRLESGAFEGPYSFQSRFAEGAGTNPEELLGAAHAGCFTMALTLVLSGGGNPPESLDTEATVHIVRDGEGFTINRIDLVTRGRVPGIDEAAFQQAAQAAKENCPLSKALASVQEITLEATLES
jgi:osmotically inducible protein OsmC